MRNTPNGKTAAHGAMGEVNLLGISFRVIGSYPTQGTFAFSQLAQLGSFWSHRFLRRRQRLQALTLRKLLPWPVAAATAALAPDPCPAEAPDASGASSSGGEAAAPRDGDTGDPLLEEEWRARFDGWRCDGDGGGGVCVTIVAEDFRESRTRLG